MYRRTFLKRSGLLVGAAAGGLKHSAAQSLPAAESVPAMGFLPATGPLRAHPDNPRYFTDGTCRAIFLTGSHTWSNFQDSGPAPVRISDWEQAAGNEPSPPTASGPPPVPVFDWEGYLTMMKVHNHNFMRLWAWQQSAWGPWTRDKILFEPLLYVRTGPGLALDGGLKFDLKKFNPVYFDRMKTRLADCRSLDIYCAVQLFQGFSSNKPGGCGVRTWDGHYYNAHNNINGVDGDRNGDKVVDYDQPAIRDLHSAYLQKVVDTVTGLNNVLYEVCNESGTKDWDWWVVDTVHKMESEKGYRHPVGLTAGTETLAQMMASPADWISPSGHEFEWDPPVWNGPMVAVSDTDHLWGHGGTAAWAWKSFARGYNTLLMDPWEPHRGAPCPNMNWGPRPGAPLRYLNRRDDPTWEPIRRAIGFTRYYANRMGLVSMTPSADVASTGYCLANPEREFLVFLPEGDYAIIDLSRVKGNLRAEWMHPVEGTIVPGGTALGGKSLRFDVPFVGPAVLYLIRE